MSNRSRKILIVVAVSNIVVLATFAFGVYFLYSERNLAYETEAEIARLRNKRTALASLARLAAETEPMRTELDGYFMTKGSEVSFLQFIERLARKSGVELKVDSAAMSSPEEGKFFGTFRLRFEATGGRERLIQFLELLETMPLASELKTARFEGPLAGREQTEATWRGMFDIAVITLLWSYD